MRSAVILGSGEKACVIGKAQALHECWDKLIGRQTAKRAVFRWDDNVEAPCRRCNTLLFCKAVQSELGSIGRNAQCGLGITRSEVITATSSHTGNVFSCIWMGRFSFHSHKVSVFDTLCQ